MIKSLHPTLKACHCGFIGTKPQFYEHMNVLIKQYTSAKQFFTEHGESILNVDDPRLDLTTQLEKSLTRKELLETI